MVHSSRWNGHIVWHATNSRKANSKLAQNNAGYFGTTEKYSKSQKSIEKTCLETGKFKSNVRFGAFKVNPF